MLRYFDESTVYAVHDYYSVTGIFSVVTSIYRRFGYDAFGKVRYMDSGFNGSSAPANGWEHLYGAYYLDSPTGLYQVSPKL
ncbi:MAG: hypothetical protein HC834_09270 [Rhodospirillales bacterium]|nr:hypothetical protein [Rhodospirillales bacterium]